MMDTCGTYIYQAPELLRDDTYRFQMNVDQWALGVVSHFLVVGRCPFGNNHHNRLNGLVDYRDTAISSQAHKFIDRCLQVRPIDRPEMSKLQVDPWFQKMSITGMLVLKFFKYCLEYFHDSF